MSTIRTRFAPSPTGHLHIGSARTALYCWLYAKKMGGTFILRIEDTDLERSTEESVQAILEGMDWLQLDYNEGPFYQTKRFDRYATVIQDLLAQDKAYRCYCSKERLDALRDAQMQNKEKPRYDGKCRDLKEVRNEPFVVRFKNPLSGEVVFRDLVRGEITFANTELDDLIIARTDGSPTYNFTVVVDDWDMNITHVIRGDDHINNTPRQINILLALGAKLPLYAHLPMILGSDGKRLSKRHGAVSVMQYQQDGFLPEALINYLARLGWSHGDQEIFSPEELIQFFDFEHINRSQAAFNPEKLLWLNQHYLKTSDPNKVAQSLAQHMQRLTIDYAHGPSLVDVVKLQAERTKTLVEMAERSRFFFLPINIEPSLFVEFYVFIKNALKALRDQLAALSEWDKESIHAVLASVAEAQGLKLGKLAPVVRIAATGGTVSPSLDATLALLGKEKTLSRLDQSLPLCTN